MLKHPELQEEIRKPMMKWASDTFSWSGVAKQWNLEFRADDLQEAMDILLKKDAKLADLMPVQLQAKNGLEPSY